MAIDTTTYGKDLSFGEFSFHATTAEYLNKFFGWNVDNSGEYNSGDAFTYTYNYGSQTESYDMEASVGQASVGLTLGGGSVEAGLEFKAGYNLGELNLDLPFSASLKAGVVNNQLNFDFTNIYDGQFKLISPSIYASVNAILNYNIGGLDAFFNASGFGQDITATIPLISDKSAQLSHEIFNIDSLLSSPKVEITAFNFVKISASLPQLIPSIKTEDNDEYSLEVAYQTKDFLSASIGFDLLATQIFPLTKPILNPGIEIPIPAPFPIFFDANLRLTPIDYTLAFDQTYSLKAGIRNGTTEIVQGDFEKLSTPFSAIDELLEKDIDNDSKIDLTLSYNPEVFFCC